MLERTNTIPDREVGADDTGDDKLQTELTGSHGGKMDRDGEEETK